MTASSKGKSSLRRTTSCLSTTRFTLSGEALSSGQHTLRFERIDKGALYYNTYLSYFTKEEGLRKASLEIKVER